ncbi:MAG: FeoB-associated Cys-rich membrane protein [Clostridia bacterium]|nr:FeoB-associated Cys-rich membrane protein [Clostridia bacterium]
MNLTDIIIVAIIVAIVGLAAFYVYKAKKSGKKCIGCPDGCCCSEAQKKSCGCGK